MSGGKGGGESDLRQNFVTVRLGSDWVADLCFHTHRGIFSFSYFSSFSFSIPPSWAKDPQSGLETFNNSQGPSIKVRDPQSGSGTLNQGQGPPIRVRDPQSRSGTLNQGQGPSITVRDPPLGPGTLDQVQRPSIRSIDP